MTRMVIKIIFWPWQKATGHHPGPVAPPTADGASLTLFRIMVLGCINTAFRFRWRPFNTNESKTNSYYKKKLKRPANMCIRGFSKKAVAIDSSWCSRNIHATRCPLFPGRSINMSPGKKSNKIIVSEAFKVHSGPLTLFPYPSRHRVANPRPHLNANIAGRPRGQRKKNIQNIFCWNEKRSSGRNWFLILFGSK